MDPIKYPTFDVRTVFLIFTLVIGLQTNFLFFKCWNYLISALLTNETSRNHNIEYSITGLIILYDHTIILGFKEKKWASVSFFSFIYLGRSGRIFMPERPYYLHFKVITFVFTTVLSILWLYLFYLCYNNYVCLCVCKIHLQYFLYPQHKTGFTELMPRIIQWEFFLMMRTILCMC